MAVLAYTHLCWRSPSGRLNHRIANEVDHSYPRLERVESSFISAALD